MFFIMALAIFITNQFAGFVVFEYTIPNVHSGIIQIDGDAVACRISILYGETIQPGIRCFTILQRDKRAFSLKVDDCIGCVAGTTDFDIAAAEVDTTVIGSGVNAGVDENQIFIVGF